MVILMKEYRPCLHGRLQNMFLGCAKYSSHFSFPNCIPYLLFLDPKFQKRQIPGPGKSCPLVRTPMAVFLIGLWHSVKHALLILRFCCLPLEQKRLDWWELEWRQVRKRLLCRASEIRDCRPTRCNLSPNLSRRRCRTRLPRKRVGLLCSSAGIG